MTREEAITELKTRYLTMSQCLDKEGLHNANEAIDLAIEALEFMGKSEQNVIKCKDCNEWHRGRNHNGGDVYSILGYCSVHRILTGENYYCGDAERI